MLPQKICFRKCCFLKTELAKPENQKNLTIFFHIFCLLRENLSNISQNEKRFSCLPRKEANFSKLKCFFFTIKKKRFLSFHNIFSILNQFIFFIFWEIFVTFTTILLLFFFSFLERFWYLPQAFFCSFSLFSWYYLAEKFLGNLVYMKKENIKKL